MDIFATVIVTSENVAQARSIADQFPGGQGMFTTGLSGNGALPITHYTSSGHIPEEILNALNGIVDVYDSDPHSVFHDVALQMVIENE